MTILSALLANELHAALKRFRKAFDRIPKQTGRHELTEAQKKMVDADTGLQRTIAARHGLLKELVDRHLATRCAA